MNAFVEKIAAGAIETQSKYGILASLTIAQAILESGWGRESVGNNIFGIKVSPSWTGGTVTCATGEVIDGQAVCVSGTFRVYASVADSIADHAQLFIRNSCYHNILNCADYRQACRNVQADGYATDPDYADKLISIIEDNDLQQFDGAQQSAPTAPASSAGTIHHIGENIVFSTCYASSTDPTDKAIPANHMARNHGTITSIIPGAHNPYLLDNGLCWVNDGDIRGPYSAPAPAAVPSSESGTYTVKPGDTLSGIALKFNTTVRQLADLNGIQNPNEIQAGSTLRLTGNPPAQSTETIYIVKPGDTLSGIAVKFNTTVSRLAEANGISNPDHIEAGWKLKIV